MFVMMKDTYKVSSLGMLEAFRVMDRNCSNFPFNSGIQESYTHTHAHAHAHAHTHTHTHTHTQCNKGASEALILAYRLQTLAAVHYTVMFNVS